jgi:DNA-binding XRE family transcriptional regulator
MPETTALFSLPSPAPKDDTPVTCPDCHGQKRALVHVDGRDEKGRHFSRNEVRACWRCGGIGTIPTDYAAQIEEGGRLREARRQRNVGVREVAERLGVTPSRLTQIEMGRYGRYSPATDASVIAPAPAPLKPSAAKSSTPPALPWWTGDRDESEVR